MGGSWQPFAYEKMLPSLQARLRPASSPAQREAQITLSGRGFWALMDFQLQTEKARRVGWIAGKESDAVEKGKELASEAAKLPTADLKARVDEYTRLIVSVMAHEGSFGARGGGPTDTQASIGIFQWGLARNSTNQAGSSMLMFFANLKREATRVLPTDPPATPEQQAEHKLYVDAWAQARALNIDVEGGVMKLNGVKPTGAAMEELLTGRHGPMATGALRTYQLVAARDWTEEFRRKPVRPGPSFPSWAGHQYSEPPASPMGLKVALEHRYEGVTYTLVLDAPMPHATVGSTFASQKNIALAVTLGANRPHWVEGALWEALTGLQVVSSTVDAMLTDIVRAAPPATRRARERAVTAADVAAWGVQDRYDELRRLIWPAPRPLTPSEEEDLAITFKQKALMHYSFGDATEHERWVRFATVEGVYARAAAQPAPPAAAPAPAAAAATTARGPSTPHRP
jgi:hypothetical protein